MRAEIPGKKAIASANYERSSMQEEIRVVAMDLLEEKANLDKDQQKKFFDLIENAMAKEGRGDVR